MGILVSDNVTIISNGVRQELVIVQSYEEQADGRFTLRTNTSMSEGDVDRVLVQRNLPNMAAVLKAARTHVGSAGLQVMHRLLQSDQRAHDSVVSQTEYNVRRAAFSVVPTPNPIDSPNASLNASQED